MHKRAWRYLWLGLALAALLVAGCQPAPTQAPTPTLPAPTQAVGSVASHCPRPHRQPRPRRDPQIRPPRCQRTRRPRFPRRKRQSPPKRRLRSRQHSPPRRPRSPHRDTGPHGDTQASRPHTHECLSFSTIPPGPVRSLASLSQLSEGAGLYRRPRLRRRGPSPGWRAAGLLQ